MSISGYSGKEVFQKLGIKPETKLLLIHAPADYNELLGLDTTGQLCDPQEKADCIHLFTTGMKELAAQLDSAIQRMKEDGMIWVSWYKKSSKRFSGITEDEIRNYILKNTELVDVKVCSISDDWSGLKLVIRKEKRK